MKTTIIAFVIVLSLAFSLVGSKGWALNDQLSIDSLKGFSGVYILVENVPSEIVLDGLTASKIHTIALKKLRVASIKVLTKHEALQELGTPYLYVNVNAMKIDSVYIYSISLDFKQNALLERSNLSTSAGTWSYYGLSIGPSIRSIRYDIEDIMDQFINAWLSVNPK